MDSITHLTQGILVERAYEGIQQPHQIPSTAPPPYTASEDDDGTDSDDSSDDSEDEQGDAPVKLTINAAGSIQGSNNLVPTSPSPLADATKFSALLLHAINRINSSTAAARTKRRVNVEMTINCGVTIVGDRNVVGNVGLKPKSPEKAVAGPGAGTVEERAAAVGAKRKAESTPDDEPRQKRPAVSSAPE